MIGKSVRLGRVFQRDRRCVIIPIDHAFTLGPIQGLEDLRRVLPTLLAGEPDAVIMHRGGIQAGLWDPHARSALIVHLSGGTKLSRDPYAKVAVGHIEDAMRVGADAVSVHVTLGTINDREMLADLAAVSSSCLAWGIPLLAMMYVHGKAPEGEARAIAHAARVAAELGADIVKVSYTGDIESFASVVQSCFVPVVVAGGEAIPDDLGVLRAVEEAMRVGSAGVCIGRNVFQHRHPPGFIHALSAIVHSRWTASQAVEQFLAPSRKSQDGEGVSVVGVDCPKSDAE